MLGEHTTRKERWSTTSPGSGTGGGTHQEQEGERQARQAKPATQAGQGGDVVGVNRQDDLDEQHLQTVEKSILILPQMIGRFGISDGHVQNLLTSIFHESDILGDALHTDKYFTRIVKRFVVLLTKVTHPQIRSFIRYFVVAHADILEKSLLTDTPADVQVAGIQLFGTLLYGDTTDAVSGSHIRTGVSIFKRHIDTVASALEGRIGNLDRVRLTKKLLQYGDEALAREVSSIMKVVIKKEQVEQEQVIDPSIMDKPADIDRDIVILAGLLEDADDKLRKRVKPLLEAWIENYGVSAPDIIQAWEESAPRHYFRMIVQENLQAIKRLEESRPGIIRMLHTEYGIRDFARYPSQLLIRQYVTHEDTTTPYGIISNPRVDESGAFYQDVKLFEHLAQQLNETHIIRVIEVDSKLGLVKSINALRHRYGPASFGIIGGHGTTEGITMGSRSSSGILRPSDVQRIGVKALHVAFVDGAPVIFNSCSSQGIGTQVSDAVGVSGEGPTRDTSIRSIDVKIGEKGQVQFHVIYNDETDGRVESGLDEEVAVRFLHRGGSGGGMNKQETSFARPGLAKLKNDKARDLTPEEIAAMVQEKSQQPETEDGWGKGGGTTRTQEGGADGYISPQIEKDKAFQGDSVSSGYSSLLSNEANLDQFLPYVRHQEGAIIGVGPDQVFDLLANSKATVAFMVDYNDSQSLNSRVFMEVGMYHKRTFGRYPTSDEYISYFDEDNIDTLKQILLSVMPSEQVEEVLWNLSYQTGTALKGLSYTDYLRDRTKFTDASGKQYKWLGTQEGINKVLGAYESGNVYIVTSDISDPIVLGKISEEAKRKGVAFNLFYWSNFVDYFITDDEAMGKFVTSLSRLPAGRNAVVLRTSNASSLDLPLQKPPLHLMRKNPNKRLVYPDWHYNVQGFQDLVGKLANDHAYLKSAWAQEAKDHQVGEKRGFSVIGLKFDIDALVGAAKGEIMDVFIDPLTGLPHKTPMVLGQKPDYIVIPHSVYDHPIESMQKHEDEFTAALGYVKDSIPTVFQKIKDWADGRQGITHEVEALSIHSSSDSSPILSLQQKTMLLRVRPDGNQIVYKPLISLKYSGSIKLETLTEQFRKALTQLDNLHVTSGLNGEIIASDKTYRLKIYISKNTNIVEVDFERVSSGGPSVIPLTTLEEFNQAMNFFLNGVKQVIVVLQNEGSQSDTDEGFSVPL